VRVLDEPVGHLLEPKADVLEADLLRDREHGHGREAVVHVRSSAREDGTVAHPASNSSSAGRRRPQRAISSAQRAAMTAFSLQVVTKARYFWRLS
jgi:hypothetical protein